MNTAAKQAAKPPRFTSGADFLDAARPIVERELALMGDGSPVEAIDRERVLYWFCADWHDGQASGSAPVAAEVAVC